MWAKRRWIAVGLLAMLMLAMVGLAVVIAFTISLQDTRGVPRNEQDKENERVKRALRWTIIFNTANGREYKAQLAHLGAILAIRMPPDGYEFMVFRDLSVPRPVGKIEDIGQSKRIYWVGQVPQSMQSLSQALGLEFEPLEVVMFFPVELEEKLLRLELTYRHLGVDQIQETRFEIRKRGGVYEPVVVAQR